MFVVKCAGVMHEMGTVLNVHVIPKFNNFNHQKFKINSLKPLTKVTTLSIARLNLSHNDFILS